MNMNLHANPTITTLRLQNFKIFEKNNTSNKVSKTQTCCKSAKPFRKEV